MNFEYDLVLMSLVIFVPSLFALALVAFPRGSEEWMRWWTLFGTAVTLVLSLWMFIDYYRDVYDLNLNQPGESTLNARAAAADSAEAVSAAQGKSASNWLARRPWIRSRSF